MIVKLQRPLSPPAGTPYLAYNQSHSWEMLLVDLPDAVVTALGDDPKGYFELRAHPGERLVWGERVDDQDW